MPTKSKLDKEGVGGDMITILEYDDIRQEGLISFLF